MCTLLVQDNVVCVCIKGKWPKVITMYSRTRAVRVALCIAHRYDDVAVVWMN